MNIPDFTSQTLSDHFVVEIVENPYTEHLPPESIAHIEQIWNQEQLQRLPHLFNGKILNHLSHTPHKLQGYFVEYKHYLAQLRDPSLRQYIPIQGVGMTGITLAENHVLIGRRAPHVTSYPYMLEFAPAGGVDADYVQNHKFLLEKALLSELKEEVGYDSLAVEFIKPFALINEPHINHWEICTKLILKPGYKEQLLHRSPEYTDIFWIPLESLPNFFSIHSDEIIPMSRYILRSGNIHLY